MHTTVQDNQIIPESEGVLFESVQQGPVNALVILTNSGVNIFGYRFQEFNGTAFVDIGLSGSPTFNTLVSGQSRSLQVTSNYPRVRLVGSASGGSLLSFSVTRYYNRPSGGSIPLLSL